jgi:WW domain
VESRTPCCACCPTQLGFLHLANCLDEHVSCWCAQDADADLELEGPGAEEKKAEAKERVDYGYGTLAEAALTPETGSAMIQSTLPSDWTAVVDPASGNVYYVNVITHESSWEPPGGMAAYEP